MRNAGKQLGKAVSLFLKNVHKILIETKNERPMKLISFTNPSCAEESH